jgi:hypothetical protein
MVVKSGVGCRSSQITSMLRWVSFQPTTGSQPVEGAVEDVKLQQVCRCIKHDHAGRNVPKRVNHAIKRDAIAWPTRHLRCHADEPRRGQIQPLGGRFSLDRAVASLMENFADEHAGRRLVVDDQDSLPKPRAGPPRSAGSACTRRAYAASRAERSVCARLPIRNGLGKNRTPRSSKPRLAMAVLAYPLV